MTEELLEFVQVEYVTSPKQSAGVPWALVAVDRGRPDDKIFILQIESCSIWIADHDRAYLDAMLLDWEITPNRNGAALLDSSRDLAIGPIRTGTYGTCTREELDAIVRSLGEQIGKAPPSQIV